jgi:spermidine synthase
VTTRSKAILFALFAATGFSALTLQVVWQRVISMHAGVDLFSFTTVVAAFLAGLGIGTIVGGTVADRLGPKKALLAYAAANAGIGVFAWFSLWLFYDYYQSVVPGLGGTLASFLFHFVLLVVPTVLMGISLPVVARGVVDRIEDAAPLVGRLYAVNTVGAGLGAAVSGWLLVGNLGFVATVRLAGTINLLAGASVFLLWRAAARARAAAPVPAPAPTSGVSEVAAPRAWPWYLLYGTTGAVALGMELIFFRVIDTLMRSNSYTFGHVLMLYLVLFGTGTAIASLFVAKARRPQRWFLGLQFGVGVAALAGLLLLVEGPGLLGIDGPFTRHFTKDGYNLGQYQFWPLRELGRITFVHVLGPLAVMGLPVLLMGAAFPFVQALVAGRFDTLGRRTGRLLFSNVVGNVAGILLVGFVLIDRLGTSGSLRLLAGVLVVPGVAWALLASTQSRRVALAAGAVSVMALALVLFPSNRELWSFFHAADGLPFKLEEDRACVNAMRPDEAGASLLFINGASQNAYPYDDYHVLIGLVPALLHPGPDRALSIGLGIGATPYGMSLDERLSAVDVVELCGKEITLLEGLAAEGSQENQRMFSDPRVDMRTGDGRKALIAADEPWDVITVDAIRHQSAFSGNLYSVEFYELVRSRMGAGGMMAQWMPTPRTVNSATEVFDYALAFTVETYGNSQFFVASSQPIAFDRDVLLGRVDALILEAERRFVLPPGQLESIRNFFATVQPVVLQFGGPAADVPERALNRDLFPRDEYFLNNPVAVENRPRP